MRYTLPDRQTNIDNRVATFDTQMYNSSQLQRILVELLDRNTYIDNGVTTLDKQLYNSSQSQRITV